MIRSLSGLEIVGCKSTVLVIFSLPFCRLWGCNLGKPSALGQRFLRRYKSDRPQPDASASVMTLSRLTLAAVDHSPGIVFEVGS
ncbi:MAG: hypothetical protein ACK5OA_06280 [Acidovorax sp.]